LTAARAVARLKSRRTLALAAATVVATAIAIMAVRYIPLLGYFERFSADFRTAMLLPAEPQDPNIVIVAITDETLERFPYRSPVDRAFLAGVLKLLDEREVRAIGLDVLLDQPTERDKDELLRATIDGLTVPLIVGYVEETDIVNDAQATFLAAFVPPRIRGLANLATDEIDDTARWIYPGRRQADGTFLLGFDYALAVRLGVPARPEQVEIAWHGKPEDAAEPFATYDAHLVDKLPPALFKNKIVLVGAELSLTDRHRTPFATIHQGNRGLLPGVVIRAHGIAQLMEGRSVLKPGWLASVAIALALAAVGALLGGADLGPAVRFGGAATVLAAFWVGGFTMFHQFRETVPLVAPSFALALALWAADSLGGREARRQRAFIAAAFSRLVSPKIVERLIHNPALLSRLRGERREMSFLFTDVADFTTMAEAVGSDRLGPLMNAYFDGLCGIVLRYDGTIDKFIGDAVFAVFNAPADQADHAARAIGCALEIDRFAETFRTEQMATGIAFGVTRIGVHTGTATYGNFGSTARQEFTALGDAVNTASRLQGANKMFGTRVCASDATRAQCPDVAFRPVAVVRLKGKLRSVAVFEPLAAAGLDADYLSRYRAAYAALEKGDARAVTLFGALRLQQPQDGCVAFHLERIKSGASGIDILLTEK
jgi:adenylate cyclase